MANKLTFLDGFFIKLIAIITMTIDHIGVALYAFYPTMPGFDVIYPTLRIIGRISMPLFIFLVFEGTLHTKSFKKYELRMGIIGLLVLIAEVIIEYVPAFGMKGFAQYQGNIFIDLMLSALAIYALDSKDNKKKLWLILPFAVGILSTICYSLEKANGYIINWFPFFLRTQYNIVSILIAVGFYLAKVIISNIFEKYYLVKEDELENNKQYRFYLNIGCAIVVILIGICWYLMQYLVPPADIFWLKDYQIWMIIAAVPLLFYNGKRGYNSKIFQYGCYLYYPLHIVIIYVIFYLITL